MSRSLLVQCAAEKGCPGKSWFITDGGAMLATHLFEVHGAETVNGKTRQQWEREEGEPRG